MNIGLSRRMLVQASCVAALSPLWPRSSRAGDLTGEIMPYVAPELRPIALQLLENKIPIPTFKKGVPIEMREGIIATLANPLAETPKWERIDIESASEMRLPVYVVNRSPGCAKPAILHMHGGGFVIGSARSVLSNLQSIAAKLDCVIVTVDYRLAPETDWRGSVEDNYAALKWLHDNADVLGVDRSRVAVMGESAGGGHAAILALIARDRGELPLCFQSLTYPMLDDRTGTQVIPPWPIGALVWTVQSNRFGWESFLGEKPGSATVPTQPVPSRCLDFAGLPPAWIGVGSIDLFVGEDIAYAKRMIDAAVPTALTVVPGAFHGFDVFAPNTRLAVDFTRSKLDALARAFNQPLQSGG